MKPHWIHGVIGLSCIVPPALGQSATLRWIEIPDGYRQLNSTALSTDGTTIVGVAHANEVGHARPFRWSAASGLQLAELPPDALQGGARGVSYDGNFVVGCFITPERLEAFRWETGGSVEPLGFPSPYIASDAYAVSYDGSFIAVYLGLLGTLGHAARYSQQYGWELLSDGSNVVFELPYAISGDGMTVGGTARDDLTRLRAPCVWNRASGLRLVSNMAGSDGRVITISADGDFCGGMTPDGAFLYSELTGITYLTGTGIDCVVTTGVRENGLRAVGLANGDATHIQRAFLWDLESGSLDLNGLVRDRFCIEPDGYLLEVSGMSVDGRAIAGYGEHMGTVKPWILEFSSFAPGDLNEDGDADLADLAVLLAHFGSEANAPADGDIDQNGIVELQDLSLLLANFGVVCQ